jgi:hypothetical protein
MSAFQIKFTYKWLDEPMAPIANLFVFASIYLLLLALIEKPCLGIAHWGNLRKSCIVYKKIVLKMGIDRFSSGVFVVVSILERRWVVFQIMFWCAYVFQLGRFHCVHPEEFLRSGFSSLWPCNSSAMEKKIVAFICLIQLIAKSWNMKSL